MTHLYFPTSFSINYTFLFHFRYPHWPLLSELWTVDLDLFYFYFYFLFIETRIRV